MDTTENQREENTTINQGEDQSPWENLIDMIQGLDDPIDEPPERGDSTAPPQSLRAIVQEMLSAAPEPEEDGEAFMPSEEAITAITDAQEYPLRLAENGSALIFVDEAKGPSPSTEDLGRWTSETIRHTLLTLHNRLHAGEREDEVQVIGPRGNFSEEADQLVAARLGIVRHPGALAQVGPERYAWVRANDSAARQWGLRFDESNAWVVFHRRVLVSAEALVLA